MKILLTKPIKAADIRDIIEKLNLTKDNKLDWIFFFNILLFLFYPKTYLFYIYLTFDYKYRNFIRYNIICINFYSNNIYFI